MKKLSLVSVLGLALCCAAPAHAGPAKRVAFVADLSGAVEVPALPSGRPASSFWIENGWNGSVSEPAALGAFTWTAIGTFAVRDLNAIPWEARVDGVRFVLDFGDGNTIQGTFRAAGTLDPTTFVANFKGHYEFRSGTGNFVHVRGAGVIGAQGPAPSASGAMVGWIEY